METHNPNNLSDDVIGVQDGWRLLYRDEILTGQRNLMELEMWDYDHWSRHWSGGLDFKTYRTKLSREDLALARSKRPVS
jgi:hypothetical protein